MDLDFQPAFHAAQTPKNENALQTNCNFKSHWITLGTSSGGAHLLVRDEMYTSAFLGQRLIIVPVVPHDISIHHLNHHHNCQH